jgi:hypothetical protein
MQKFSLEVNVPIEITLTDNKRWDESKAILEIVPTKNGNGFVIFIKEMSDHVSYMDERDVNFVFDKDAFETRMREKFGDNFKGFKQATEDTKNFNKGQITGTYKTKHAVKK